MFARSLGLSQSHPRILAARASLRKYTTDQPKAPNEGIVKFLTRCLQEEEAKPSRNGYKVRSFNHAIAALRTVGHEITSGQDAMTLRGIGAGIAERIDMHLQGKEYDPTSVESSGRAKAQLISQFRTVPGLGERTAEVLVEAGAKSLADLTKRKFSEHLTEAQRVGMTYAGYLERPISREEAETIAAFLRDHISSKFEVIVTGAYRLGAEQLSEVNILLIHPSHVHIPEPGNISSRTTTLKKDSGSGALPLPFRHGKSTAKERRKSPLLQEVVPTLMDAGLLAATLSASPSKWQGIALLPKRDISNGQWKEVGDRLRDLRAFRGCYMRLDLNLAPVHSRGAALLALTGDSDFYRHARTVADRVSMHLNEYGLWRVPSLLPEPEAAELGKEEADSCTETLDPVHSVMSKEPLSPRLGFWKLLAGDTEESILEELDIGWIEPVRRNFRFLKDKPAGKRRKLSAHLDLSSFVLKGLASADGSSNDVGPSDRLGKAVGDKEMERRGRPRKIVGEDEQPREKRARGRPRKVVGEQKMEEVD